MNYVNEGWNTIKLKLNSIDASYTFDETKQYLLNDFYYKNYFGRAKNRTMIKEHPELYKSVYIHSELLERTMKKYERHHGWYNFKYRLKFIAELNGNIELLKCKCGDTYTWNTYCRRCPDYHKTMLGKKHTKAAKQKMRVSVLNYLKKTKGQITPRYNVNSIPIIEDYGKQHGYNFKHAENGGEFYIKELGYFLDAYDEEKNVVLEVDEPHHFKRDGTLRKKDVARENEIKDFLKCKFIRIKYEK